MRKLTTLFLLLFLLGGYSARGQSVVWQDHFTGCAKSITYDAEALSQGFPAGTWGPADNPSEGPSKVYIGQHALRFKVPMSPNPFSLKGVHLGFAPGTKVVGTADNFRFNIYRVQGNSMSILGGKQFKLTDFSDIGKPFQVTNNFLDLSGLNINGLNSGDDIIFALETKTATSDDIINLYFTLPTDDAECSKVPSNWLVDVKDASNHKSISSLPIGMNEFFGLDKGASKDDGKVGNPAIFPDVEITSQTEVQICAGQCADLNTNINGTAYKWRPSLGVSNPNIRSPRACPRRTTQYIVAVTTPGGTIEEDTVNVIVNEIPIATIVPNGPTQFCEGLTVDLNIENPKSLPFTYQWFRDGLDLELNTDTITVDKTGLYDVIITNGACVRRSTATYVYVVPSTTFEIDGWPYTCGAGYTVMEIIGGENNQEFTWNPPTDLTIAPGGRSVVFKAPGGTTRTYTVSTVSFEGCPSSKEITLHSGTDTVYSAITGITNNQTICSNVGKYKIKVGPFRKFGTLTTSPTLPDGVITEDPSDNRSFIINTELITVPMNNVTFTWSGNFNGCNFTAKVSRVNLMPAPIAALNGFRDLVCVDDNTPFDITGSPTGGDITITPSTPAANKVTPNVIRFIGGKAQPGEYTIKYVVKQGACTDSIVRRFSVILRDQPAIITPANGTFCTSEGNIVLNGSPIGGQFSINNVILPPTFEGRLEFDPALIPFNGNDTTVTVTYSGTALTCSMNTSTEIRIVRSDLILTNFPDDNMLCLNEDFEFTVSPSTVVLGGMIVGKGQAIELIDPPSGKYRFRGTLAPYPGKFLISFTLNSPSCPPFSILREITISQPPSSVAILGIPLGPLCTNREPFELHGVPFGGTFESELGAIAPGTPIYDPSLIPAEKIPKLGESFEDVIHYFGSVGGCEYSIFDTITLISAKNPVINIPDSICSDTAAFEFTIDMPGGKFEVDSYPEAFTQINETTWRIDPAKIGHIHTVTITYSGVIGICEYKGVKKVTVDRPLTQDEIIINIDGNPELICSTGQPILLTGFPLEGKFRGLGVEYIGDDAYFNPNTQDVNNKLGIIEFTGHKGGCTFSKFDTLNVFKVGDEFIGLSDTVCQGAVVPFIASPSGGTCELTFEGNTMILDLQGIYFELNPSDYIDPPLNPGETASISVHYFGSLPNGCSYDITKDVTITADFTEASITGLKSEFCASEADVVLTAFPLGGTYKLNGETNVPGLVDNKLSPRNLAPGVYTVTYEGSAGSCGFRSSQDIEIKAAPEAIIGTPDGTTYCVGNSVRLEANPSTGNYRYQWFLNNSVLNGATSQTLTDSKGGYYQVEITDLTTNCSDKSDSVFTNVIKSKLEWDNRASETFTKGPSESHTGCNDDGYILATIKERYPGERFEFMINGKGPYSSGMNFIEFYSLIDPSNPDFSISGGKYKITAVDASGCQIDTTLIVLSNCCEMPTDLVIANSEPDNGSFNLSWTGPQGTQGFEVQIKKASDVDWGPRIILDGTATTYFFKDLFDGETYCARIRTICEADPFTGGPNDTVYTASKWDTLCVTLVNDCPTVFSEITISNVTASGARISWDPVPTVIGYLVEYTLTSGGTTESISTTSTSVEITGLEINENYTVTVKSDCGAGNYSSGIPNFFSTLEACPSPQGIAVFDELTKTASVSWDAAPGAISYEVRYTNDAGVATTKSTQFPMYEIEGLDCGANYSVEIRSICSSSSTSDWSGAVFFSTDPCCGSVTKLLNTEQTATSLTFEWDAVPGSTSYSVTYVNTITSESKTVKAPSNKIILTSLGLNTTYEVSVITICSSDSSGKVIETASTNDACPSPLEIKALTISPTTAEIIWLAPTGTTSFILEYEISGSGVTTAIPVTGTKFTISGLQKGTNYDVRIKTECLPGSESSAIQTDFTTCDACGEVAGVAVSQFTSFSSMVTWTGGVCGTTYQVRYRNASLVGGWQTRITQSNSLMLLSLEPNTEYEVQVRTVCGPSDVSSWSTSKFLRTLNGNTCGIPNGLIAINIQKDRATFVWNTVNNATNYDVYVREETETVYKFVERSSVNNLVLGGLNAGTKYYVKVRANCTSISGDFTPEVFFMTLSGKEFAMDQISEFRVYPNPTRGDVLISFTSDSEHTAEFSLIDVTGRVVFKQQATVKEGDNELTLPISNSVTTGIYLLNFEINGNRQSIKLVVE